MRYGSPKIFGNLGSDDKYIVEEVAPGKTIQYEKLRVLGKGTFSKVYACHQLNSNQIFAIKVVSKTFLLKNNLKEQFMKEIKIHFLMDHQNIIRLHKVFENRTYIFMVMEYSENGTIADLIERRKTLSEVESRYYFRSLLEGIKYIHEKNVVHRDLKPANLIISNKMELKIADFGLASTIVDKKRRRTFCGTPFFIAPEIVLRKDGHSYEVDYWSAGIILYNMAYGKCPFYSETTEEVYKKIKESEFATEANVSPELNDLLKKLLCKSPEDRATYDICFASPFLAKLRGPDFLPAHFLETAPSESFINKYEEHFEKDIENVNNNPNDVNVYSKAGSKSSYFEGNIDSIKDRQDNDYEYIKKWVNFSEKFGIGYILNNMIIGIYFTDRTKIVLSNFGITFNYIYTKNDRVQTEQHNILTYPKELEKKVTILDFFINYLKENGYIHRIHENTPDNLVYVKNYKISKYAVLFYLSNEVYQCIFEDGVEVHINKNESEKRVVFIDKQRNRTYSDGKNITDETLLKRIKYIKETLKSMN